MCISWLISLGYARIMYDDQNLVRGVQLGSDEDLVLEALRDMLSLYVEGEHPMLSLQDLSLAVPQHIVHSYAAHVLHLLYVDHAPAHALPIRCVVSLDFRQNSRGFPVELWHGHFGRGFAHQRSRYCNGGVRYGPKVVASFEANSNFPISQRHEHMRHVGVALWRHKAAAKLVPIRRIKPCGNNDKVRIELLGYGHNNLLEGGHILAVAHALIVPADVDVLPRGVPASHVLDAAVRRRWIRWLSRVKVSVEIHMY